MTNSRLPASSVGPLLAIVLLIVGCGGGGATTSSPSPVPVAAGPSFTLDAPANVSAGAEFSLSWAGNPNRGDYVVVVPAGATKVTNDESYVDLVAEDFTSKLIAPLAPGGYEIWLVEGDTLGDTANSIKARRPLTVS